MAAVALIRFTQGVTVGLPGVALVGSSGTAVQVENDTTTDIQSWKIDLLYSPPGSTVVPATLATGNSNTPLANFTPDAVPGTYRILLTVYSGLNQTGQSNKDIRCFAVRDSQGFIYPPYQQLPPKLPIQGSGIVGEKPDEMNFNGQPYGWDGDGTDGLMLTFMREVSNTLDVLGGGGIGVVRELTGNRTETIPEGREALHMRPVFLDNGSVALDGELTSIDFPENHSLTKIPHRSYKRVGPHEAMFYEDLVIEGHLDLQGDLIPVAAGGGLTGQDVLDLLTSIAPNTPAILGVASPASFLTPEQARTVLDVPSNEDILELFEEFEDEIEGEISDALSGLANFDLLWAGSNSDGSYGGSEIVFTSDFTAETNRIHRWDGSVTGINAILPGGLSALHNVWIAFYEVASNGANYLTINAQGLARIRSRGTIASGTTPIRVRGVNCYIVLRYEASQDLWEVVQGEELVQDTVIDIERRALGGTNTVAFEYIADQNTTVIVFNFTAQAATATGDVALYNIRAIYKRDSGGTVSQVAVTKTVDHEDDVGWDVTFSLVGPVIQIRVIPDGVDDTVFRLVGKVTTSSFA